MKLTGKHLLLGFLGLLGVGVLALIGTFMIILYVFSGESGTPSHPESAIKVTLEWGRLAPLPSSTTDFTITTRGNMFNRSFRVEFTAPPGEIEQWLKQSPGTRETSASAPSPGVRRFEIAPGRGAQQAEVTVDDSKHRVVIYVKWS